MRIAKCTLLITALSLSLIHCGGKKDGPDAKRSIEKYKAVRIATDATNLPFEFGSGTGVQGMDVDIGTEIAKDLGYEAKWVKVPFARLFDILQNGEAEVVISAIAVTPERKKEFSFTTPYFDSSITIARRQDKKDIKDLASLSGKKVGVQSGSPSDTFMSSRKNVTLVRVTTLDDALGALNRGEVDAVVGDEPILVYSIYKSFPNLITTGARLQSLEYAVVVRKGEKDLSTKVNGTIERLKKSGELETLRKKWFQNVMEEAVEQRKKLEETLALQEAPKAVAFDIVKAGGGFNMDRLDGFQLVLNGEKGSFQSTPILTSGSRGNCRFTQPIPPGEYKLNMSILRMVTNVNIPKTPSRSITKTMRIGVNSLTIE